MTWLSRVMQGRQLSFLNRVVPRQFGSSSAALQLDYSSDEGDDSDWNRLHSQPLAESAEGWVPGRGVQWVVIGDSGPSVKRHAYAERLSKLLEVPLISMGSLLRQELHPRSPLYQQISRAVNERKLVPEDVIFGLLTKKLDECHENDESGFILDGIPRTRYQAEILDKVADIDLVINLKPEEKSERKSCLVMNRCVPGSSSWGGKFHIYPEKCNELEKYYEKQKKLVQFEVASAAPAETWHGLLTALDLGHMSVLKPTHKYVA